MKKIVRLLSAVLACLMLLVLFAGCGKDKDKDQEPENPTDNPNVGGTGPALSLDSKYLFTTTPGADALSENFELKWKVGSDEYTAVRYLGSWYTEIRKPTEVLYNAYVLTDEGGFNLYAWNNMSTEYTVGGYLTAEAAMERIGGVFDVGGSSAQGSYLAWIQMCADVTGGTNVNMAFDLDEGYRASADGTVAGRPTYIVVNGEGYYFFIDQESGALLKLIHPSGTVFFEHLSFKEANCLGTYKETNVLDIQPIIAPTPDPTPDITDSFVVNPGFPDLGKRTKLTTIISEKPTEFLFYYAYNQSFYEQVFSKSSSAGRYSDSQYSEYELINKEYVLSYLDGTIYTNNDGIYTMPIRVGENVSYVDIPAEQLYSLMGLDQAPNLFNADLYTDLGGDKYQVKPGSFTTVVGCMGSADMMEHLDPNVPMYMYPVEDGLYFYQYYSRDKGEGTEMYEFCYMVKYKTHTVVDVTKKTIGRTFEPKQGMVEISGIQAAPGETVTVKPTPRNGYVLDKILVDGVAIDGNTFVMPDHDVKVEVTFAALETGGTTGGDGSGAKANVELKQDPNGLGLVRENGDPVVGKPYRIRWESNLYYTLDYFLINDEKVTDDIIVLDGTKLVIQPVFKLRDDAPLFNIILAPSADGEVFCDAETALPGTEVSVSYLCGVGNAFNSLLVNGKKIENATFTMPAYDVTVSAVFDIGVVPVYDITVNVTEGDTTTVVTTTYHKCDEGREVGIDIVLGAHRLLESVTVDGVAMGSNRVFTMPAHNVVISVVTKAEPTYGIQWMNPSGKTFDVTFSKTDAYAGEEITILCENRTFEVMNSAGTAVQTTYEIAGFTLNGQRIIGDTFVMPKSRAIISAVVRDANATELTTNMTATANGAKYTYIKGGDRLPYGIATDEVVLSTRGAYVSRVTVNGQEVEVTDGKFSYVMPESGTVSVNILIERVRHTLTIENEGCTAFFADGYLERLDNFSVSMYGDGKISIDVTPDPGMYFSHLLINGEPYYGKTFSINHRDIVVKVVCTETANNTIINILGDGDGTVEIDGESAYFIDGEYIFINVTPAADSVLSSLKVTGATALSGQDGVWVKQGKEDVVIIAEFRKKVDVKFNLYLDGVLVNATVTEDEDGNTVYSYGGFSVTDKTVKNYIDGNVVFKYSVGDYPIYHRGYFYEGVTFNKDIYGSSYQITGDHPEMNVYFERAKQELRLEVYIDDTLKSSHGLDITYTTDIYIGDSVDIIINDLPEYYRIVKIEHRYVMDTLSNYVLQEEFTTGANSVTLTIDHPCRNMVRIYVVDLRRSITSTGTYPVEVPETALVGETLTFTVPDDGDRENYVFDYFEVNGVQIAGNTFVIPEDAGVSYQVEAVFKAVKTVRITIKGDGIATATTEKEIYDAGETITLTLDYTSSRVKNFLYSGATPTTETRALIEGGYPTGEYVFTTFISAGYVDIEITLERVIVPDVLFYMNGVQVFPEDMGTTVNDWTLSGGVSVEQQLDGDTLNSTLYHIKRVVTGYRLVDVQYNDIEVTGNLDQVTYMTITGYEPRIIYYFARNMHDLVVTVPDEYTQDGSVVDITVDKTVVCYEDVITITVNELSPHYKVTGYKVSYYNESVNITYRGENTTFSVMRDVLMSNGEPARYRVEVILEDVRNEIVTDGLIPVTASASRAFSGETVTLAADLQQINGLVDAYFVVDGVQITGNTFVMPDKAVTVSAVGVFDTWSVLGKQYDGHYFRAEDLTDLKAVEAYDSDNMRSGYMQNYYWVTQAGSNVMTKVQSQGFNPEGQAMFALPLYVDIEGIYHYNNGSPYVEAIHEVFTEDDSAGTNVPVLGHEIITSTSTATIIGLGLEDNTSTTDMCFFVGTITSITNTTYGNMYVTDSNGDSIYIYGLNDLNGTRYGSMTNPPQVGDTIFIKSVIMKYVQASAIITIEFKDATLLSYTGSAYTDEETMTNELKVNLGLTSKQDVDIKGTLTKMELEGDTITYYMDFGGEELIFANLVDAKGHLYGDMISSVRPMPGYEIVVRGTVEFKDRSFVFTPSQLVANDGVLITEVVK